MNYTLIPHFEDKLLITSPFNKENDQCLNRFKKRVVIILFVPNALPSLDLNQLYLFDEFETVSQ